MPSFIADHPMLCALALIFIDIGVWRLISAELANWKLAARLVIFAVFSAVLFNDGMNPMLVAPVCRQHRAAPGRHRVADRLVAVRGADPDSVARRGDDAARGPHRSAVAGPAGRGDFPDCDHRRHGLRARPAGQGSCSPPPVRWRSSSAWRCKAPSAMCFPGSCSTPPSRTSSMTGFPSTAPRGASPISIGALRGCRPPGQHGGDPQFVGGQGQDRQLFAPGGYVRPVGQPASQPPRPPADGDRGAGAGDARVPAAAGQTGAERGVQNLGQRRRGV